MSPDPIAVYCFGDFRLDSGGHLLERDGVPIPLSPKAFQILVLLVEKPGGLITKEELIDAVWVDVVVQENNLTQQISLLRRTLGDGWIETVPRVGYRFIGEVRRDSELVVVASEAPVVHRSRGPALFGAAALVIVALIAGTAFKRSSSASASTQQIRSLAVLPLRTIGPSQASDYLGLGIADALIYQLSVLPSLDVRPTSSIGKYAGGTYDSRLVAKELAVEALLEGTIQREGDRVRIRVQLVDLRRNVPIFSGKFDEPAGDLFAVEDLVASAVARALTSETAGGDRAQASKRRSRKPGAYEAYLKGRFEWSKRTPDGIKASIPHYEEAIARDGSYAAAYAALGDSLNLLSMHRATSPRESFPRAKEAAQKALSLDESLADAYVVLGTGAFYYDWDWTAAERNLRRAIELDPQNAAARHIFANLLIANGRVDEAVATMAEAIRRDPLSIPLSSVAAYQLYFARRYDDAIRQARKTLDRDSNYAQAHRVLGQAYVASGRYDEGLASIERAVNIIGEDTYAIGLRANAYAHDPAQRDKALAIAPRLLDLFKRGKLSPFELVRFYAILGERREAIRWLEVTKERRDPGMVWLALDPELDAIRDEPRFRELVAAMNLTEADGRLNGNKRKAPAEAGASVAAR